MITEKLPQVNDFLKDLLFETKYADGLPAPACTVFSNNGTCGDIYRIFIDNKFKGGPQEVCDGLFMHEAGHIIFGHMKNMNTKNSIAKMKIRAAYPKVAKRFDSAEQFEKYFDKILFNIVEDFEVNSKLFTPEAYKELDTAVSQGRGFYPSDYDFPLGKSYNIYLNLILADPEKFFEKMKENMQNSGSDGESSDNDAPDPFKNENSSSNESNKEELDTEKSKNNSNSKSNKKPLVSNWKFSKEEIESLKQESKAHDEQIIKAVVDKLTNVSNSKERGNSGSSEKINEILEIKSFELLEKYIMKELTKNTKTVKRDMLHNYNRNKIGTSVLIPAVRNEKLTKKATIYAIVDTSGSVDSQLVQGFTGSFRKISKRLGYGSRIIYCNTQVEADYGIKDKIKPFRGGGTQIANGIEYVNKKYNPKTSDVVYIISDFEDSMDEWNEVLDKMHCKKKGILWGGDTEASNRNHLDEVLSFKY